MDPKEIGRKIKQLRRQRGLTQSMLAERINVSYQQVQKYEQGHSRISVQRLSAIARALDCPISVFLPDEKPLRVAEDAPVYPAAETLPFRLSPEEAALLKQFRKIGSKKIRAGLLKILKGIADLQAGR